VADEENGALAPIIIKKINKGKPHAAHSSAWKVAYADFVTAMMAFFMLLWLLNVTTEEQKSGIADYFAPTTASLSKSGSGGVLGGKTVGEDGAKSAASQTVIIEIEDPVPGAGVEKATGDEGIEDAGAAEKAEETAQAEEEEQAFEDIQEQLSQMLESSALLADLADHMLVDMTPEGLRIQLIDQQDRSMFEAGSARINEFARTLLNEVAKIIQRLPNRLAISGHTDAGVSGRSGYGNWELSADRANASRIVLEAAGIQDYRMNSVTGRAATEPLILEDPYLPSNRRIGIVLLREAKVLPPKYFKEMDYANGQGQ